MSESKNEQDLRKGYKMTELGPLPEEWDVVRLGDVADEIYYGVTAKATDENTGIKMLRTTDIKNYSSDWDRLPFCEITEKRNNLDKYFLKKGELIVARAGTVGVSVLAEKDFNDTIFGSYLIKIKPKPETNPKYLHYFFQSHIYWKHLVGAQGSTLKNINLPLLKSLKLPLPPLPEQRRIAAVLGTVDRALEVTWRDIEATGRLKKGLMQRLFTKGIGHTRFRDTELGPLPEQWDVVRLGEVGKDIRSGITPRGGSSIYLDNGIPLIRSQNVLMNKLSLDDVAYISKEIHNSMSRSIVKPGDILLNITGASIGRVVVVPPQIVEANVNQHVCRIRLSNNNVEPHYVSYYLASRSGQYQIMSFQSGATRQGLNYQQVRSIKLPLPPLPEQRRIAEILGVVDRRLDLLRRRKERLVRVKNGLMNDLLTGRKRVPEWVAVDMAEIWLDAASVGDDDKKETGGR